MTTAERVVIPPSVRAAMIAQLTLSPDVETGGILFGRSLGDRTVLVTAASPPGPHAVRRPRFFRRDTPFLQRWLDRRWRQAHSRDDYVGEWHVHHALGVGPSPTDRRELYKVARRPNYPTRNPVLVIIEADGANRCFAAYGFTLKPRKKCMSLVALDTTAT